MIQTKTFMALVLGLVLLSGIVGAQISPGIDFDKVKYYEEKTTIVNPLQGDVDGDNDVDMEDYEFLRDYLYFNGDAPNPIEYGNVNEKGDIDISDITLLIEILKSNGVIDVIAPVIELDDPEDDEKIETSKNSKRVYFEYTVTDDSEIDYCVLIIDGDEEERHENPETGIEHEFEENLREGEYEWKIKCVDVNGNIGFSEERDLEIDEKSTPGDSSDNYLDFGEEDSNQDYWFIESAETTPEKEKSLIEKIDWKIALLITLVLLIILTLMLIVLAISKK